MKEIYYKEFFRQVKGRFKPLRIRDTEGFIILATEENYDHIFFKKGLFLVERGERVYLIKKTIVSSRNIFEDRESQRRCHYLQPYAIKGNIESFCVVTERKRHLSWIVTAFPVEWERVYAFLLQK